MVISSSSRTKSLSPFLASLFLFVEDDSRTHLVFAIVKFCFLLPNTPKLGRLANIHKTINRWGCLDLMDIQGHGEVGGYQGEQNWVEIWNLWVTRIPMVSFFFLSSEIVSWYSGNGMCTLVQNAIVQKHSTERYSYSEISLTIWFWQYFPYSN